MQAREIIQILWEADDDDAPAYDYYERYAAGVSEILSAFFARAPGATFKWPVVDANRLAKIWLDFGRSHVVRDEKGMQAITDRVLSNIAMLAASTALLGHSREDPKAIAADAGEEYVLTDEDQGALGDFLTHSDGSWLLSDYGLPQLERLYTPLFRASTAEEQLYAVDRVLNVIHQRSDLASLFVRGGQQTLTRIANQGGYSAP